MFLLVKNPMINKYSYTHVITHVHANTRTFLVNLILFNSIELTQNSKQSDFNKLWLYTVEKRY